MNDTITVSTEHAALVADGLPLIVDPDMGCTCGDDTCGAQDEEIPPVVWVDADQPCSLCEGVGGYRATYPAHLAGSWLKCPDCHGTGRKVVELAIECAPERWCAFCESQGCEESDRHPSCQCPPCDGGDPLGLFIIQVLPIVELDKHDTVGEYVVQGPETGRFWQVDNREFPIESRNITLPDSAKPGQYAILATTVTA